MELPMGAKLLLPERLHILKIREPCFFDRVKEKTTDQWPYGFPADGHKLTQR